MDDDPIRFDRDEAGRYALPPRPRTFAGMAWWEMAMVAVMAAGLLLTLVQAVFWLTTAAFAADMPACRGGDRAARKVTCIVDGDTGWERGINWRLTTRSGGVDAPEVSQPNCAAEREIGQQATARLRALMAGGYEIKLGKPDRYDRALAVVTLQDGRDAGEVLIAEGLAQEWPNLGNQWCDQGEPQDILRRKTVSFTHMAGAN